jgi:hypothetical protein
MQTCSIFQGSEDRRSGGEGGVRIDAREHIHSFRRPIMTSSSLQGSALDASRAALAAALIDNENEKQVEKENDQSQSDSQQKDGQILEPLEIPVNMENQAEEIRTVFNDPQRFNVKARSSRFSISISPFTVVSLTFLSSSRSLPTSSPRSHLPSFPASTLHLMDTLVRFPSDKG